jgi:DNA invertase Pin-like site-specific DNA recombinase
VSTPTSEAAGTVRAAAYIRCDERTQLDAVAHQLPQLRDYIASRPGWTYAAQYVDIDPLAGQPELGKLLAAVADGQYDALVVADVSRLSRHPDDAVRVLDILRLAGVQLHTLDGSSAGAVPTGDNASRLCVASTLFEPPPER